MAELFRQSALDTMATPEQLDKQVKIVSPSAWMIGAILGMGMLTLILWGVTYTMTNGLNTQGIIFSNKAVKQVKASRACVVNDVLVSKGEYVDIGDIIAVLSNSEVLHEIEELKKIQEKLSVKDKEYEELENQIQRLMEEYTASTVIKSTTYGYVQSVIGAGNALQEGENIATIMPDSGYNEVICYISMQKAQNLKVGMLAQVSPSSF